MQHHIRLHVFTRGEVGGNPLGVITDPAGLDGPTMQAIATDLGYSETIFIGDGETPLIRIFTPGAELPFAGHPLVGAAWMMGTLGRGGPDRVRCGIGEIPYRSEGDLVWVDTPPVSAVTPQPDPAALAAGLGLGDPERAWVVAMPLPYLLLDLGSEQAVAGITPDFVRLARASWDGVMALARDGGRVRVRFFAPKLGVPEDPATGSAAAALAAALRFEGEPEGALEIEQGEEIGAPSTIHLAWSAGVVSLGGTVRSDGAVPGGS